jgi:UDP-N-acetyl-D-mannosaminuronic acid dehydrogenase
MLPPESKPTAWRGPYTGPAGAPRQVALIGCGVIGLPTALLLAQAGHRVCGVDINPQVVRSINDWTLELLEPELREVAAEPGTRERFSGSLVMPQADVFIIAAPTPLDHENKTCDYGAVDAVVSALLPQLRKGNLILLESTVAPLCCRERIAPKLRELGFSIGEDIFLAFCPERVLPGTAWYELIHNDRVIGGFTQACAIEAAKLYRTFVKGELVLTDCTTAELCKLAENAFRDVNIAFANELGLAADTLGVDRYELIGLANRHPRVEILTPGIGVGGHCLPIDPYFIGEAAPAHARMIHTARAVNDGMPAEIARRIRTKIQENWAEAGRTPSIVGFGLTYKPNTPDVRESPAVEVWKALADLKPRVYDPLVPEQAYEDFWSAVAGADFIFVIVPQQQVLAELEAHRETLAAQGTKVFHQNQL